MTILKSFKSGYEFYCDFSDRFLKGKRTKRMSDEQVVLAKARLREIRKGNQFLNSEIDLKDPELVKLFEATVSQDNMSVDEYLKKVLYFYSQTVDFDLDKDKEK